MFLYLQYFVIYKTLARAHVVLNLASWGAMLSQYTTSHIEIGLHHEDRHNPSPLLIKIGTSRLTSRAIAWLSCNPWKFIAPTVMAGDCNLPLICLFDCTCSSKRFRSAWLIALLVTWLVHAMLVIAGLINLGKVGSPRIQAVPQSYNLSRLKDWATVRATVTWAHCSQTQTAQYLSIQCIQILRMRSE